MCVARASGLCALDRGCGDAISAGRKVVEKLLELGNFIAHRRAEFSIDRSAAEYAPILERLTRNAVFVFDLDVRDVLFAAENSGGPLQLGRDLRFIRRLMVPPNALES